MNRYLTEYDKEPNFFVMNKKELESISIFLKSSDLSFHNVFTEDRIIDNNWLVRILQSIVYFCENKFSIKYFFEIVSLINTDLSSEFISFFEKNIINHDFCISRILNFGNLRILHFNLFSDVIDWYKKIKKFYKVVKKKTFISIFLDNIELLNEILLIFQSHRAVRFCSYNLTEKICDLQINISILSYCEYLKTQNVYISNTKDSTNILINHEIFSENIGLLRQRVNIFYFIKNKEELDDFVNSDIFRQNSLHESENFVFILKNLKNSFVDFKIRDDNLSFHKFIDARLTSSSAVLRNSSISENEKEVNLKNFYKTQVEKFCSNSQEIELNQFSIQKLIKDENKFFREDLLGFKIESFPRENFIVSGYFGFLFSNLLKRFFKNQHRNSIFLLKEEIEKFYHKAYFGYVYKKMSQIFSNFLICFQNIKTLGEEKFYTMTVDKKVSYKVRIRNKTIRVRSHVWIILENREEIVLYDFFDKQVSNTDFKNLKKPSIVVAALYFVDQFPNKRIIIRYFNVNDKIEEKEIKEVSELVEKLKNSLLKFKKYIVKEVFTSI